MLEAGVDTRAYYESVDRMEKLKVDREYVQGWIGGYMKNPRREEQRVSEAYDAGYEDGENQDDSNFERWIGS